MLVTSDTLVAVLQCRAAFEVGQQAKQERAPRGASPRRRAAPGVTRTLGDVSTTGTAAWLRRLDEDAATGGLWRRPLFYVPVHLVLGVILGGLIGSVGAVAFFSGRPLASVRSGPGGEPLTIANDYSMMPIVGAVSGAALGLIAGGLLALRRWRHDD